MQDIPNYYFSLRNLLAVLHGDGGHHTDKVGLKQSIEDAIKKVNELHLKIALQGDHNETQN